MSDDIKPPNWKRWYTETLPGAEHVKVLGPFRFREEDLIGPFQTVRDQFLDAAKAKVADLEAAKLAGVIRDYSWRWDGATMVFEITPVPPIERLALPDSPCQNGKPGHHWEERQHDRRCAWCGATELVL